MQDLVSVRELVNLIKCLDSSEITYPMIYDDVNVPNDNDELLFTICADNDLVLNNLLYDSKQFPGKKTFRKCNEWVSEIDTCVVSLDIVNYLSNFCVVQRSDPPSDHAPLTVTVSSTSVDLDNLFTRVSFLGGHAALLGNVGKKGMLKKPVVFNKIDKSLFRTNLDQVVTDFEAFGVDECDKSIVTTLYNCAQNSLCTFEQNEHQNYFTLGRWERLLTDKDDARVWRAIAWRGDFDLCNPRDDCPTDEELRVHFDAVLNPVLETPSTEITTDVSIPILDDPILPDHVEQQIKKMKPDKACGPDSLLPGVFSLLPVQWILTLTALFNSIFLAGTYPLAWIRAKVFMIFKKGDRLNKSNFRGISVINAIAKLFNMVFCERLLLGFAPFQEQAGAHRGRRCIEHVVTLRLLTDTARRKKVKLFVIFVDFSKAYDLVPKEKLFFCVKDYRLWGCDTGCNNCYVPGR